jgi:hypothetical protein
MSEDNIWLQGRTREAAALEVITAALEAEPGHHAQRDGTSDTGTSGTDARAAGPRAVRGAGVVARTDQAAARATGKKGTNQA